MTPTPSRAKPPYVLGLVRFAGKEYEAILTRHGSVHLRSLWSGQVSDGWSLHEASGWLRDYAVGSA